MATVIALSLDALHDYRAYLVSVKSKQAFETVSDEQFCLMTNITDKEGRLSYAGLMMFGKVYRVTAYIPTFCVDYIEIPGNRIEDADLSFTYRIPEQENIWNTYRIISRRLLTIVDVPFKMDSEGRNVGDTSQYVILREALANFLMHADQFNGMSLSGVEKAARNMKASGEIERKNGRKSGSWLILK